MVQWGRDLLCGLRKSMSGSLGQWFSGAVVHSVV